MVSRVEINADGRHVVIDHEGELAHLADTAQRIWRDTETRTPTGFAAPDTPRTCSVSCDARR